MRWPLAALPLSRFPLDHREVEQFRSAIRTLVERVVADPRRPAGCGPTKMVNVDASWLLARRVSPRAKEHTMLMLFACVRRGSVVLDDDMEVRLSCARDVKALLRRHPRICLLYTSPSPRDS